ncbi:MAG: hypothetical protein V2I97_02890 [Desulfococcaceae bacterium]|jgi:hypothetical protein|nr:hypothetical protein [Desulfococcaceae bacterium]
MSIPVKYEEPASGMETFKKITVMAATCIGLLIILIGLKYTVDIFNLIYDALKEPEQLHEILVRLGENIGGDALDVTVGKKTIPISMIMALMVFCGGAVVLAWLAMALMQTGGKIVSWTAGDREAVKKILQYAFGDAMKVRKNGKIAHPE